MLRIKQGHNNSLKLRFLGSMSVVVKDEIHITPTKRCVMTIIKRSKQTKIVLIAIFVMSLPCNTKKSTMQRRCVNDQNFILELTLLHTVGGFRLHQ